MRRLYICLIWLALLVPSVASAASTPTPVNNFRNYSTLQQLGAGPENTLLYKGRQIVAGGGGGWGSATVQNLTLKAGPNMEITGNDTDKSVTFSAVMPWVDVWAKGDGQDDTATIQAAVDAMRPVFGTVFLHNGTYKITDTIRLSDGTQSPPNIKGESAKGVILSPTMAGTTPCFQDKRTSVTFPNKSVIENFTIQPATFYTGTAIEVSGAIGIIVRNVYINRANYGIWLHDDSGPGTWTEANVFEDIWCDLNNNAIRLETGTGNGSFHANEFQRVNINIGANQTGLNHVSGYWYNSRFNLAMWALDPTATVVNAQGNAENNVGSITLEIQPVNSTAKITGSSTGRFWFTGPFNYQGGTIVDTAGHSSDGSGVFMASNYRYSTAMQNSTISAFTPTVATFNPHNAYNGRDSMGLFQMNADGNTSYLLNGFGGGWLFTSNSPYNQPLETAAVGLAVNLDGSAITSYSTSGMGLLTGPSNYAAFIKDGQFYIGSPDRKMRILPGLGDANGNIVGDPGNLVMTNHLGTGELYLKKSGANNNTGWGRVLTSFDNGTGDSATVGGFTASQTPTAGQIPVLKSTGSLVIPNNFSGAGTQHVFGQTAIHSTQISVTINQDVLLAYNDYFSGTMTVTYTGTGRFCVKSFTITASNGHTPTSADYLKLRGYYAVTNSLGVPYIKLTTDGSGTPHIYIPVANAVSDGKLTVTFTSDIGHHPYFMPAGPSGTLGTATALTGL